jgi:ACS family hexuronate transporter-like MFS transporter
LLAATTINYIDRQTLSVLAPLLQRELHLSTQEYSYAVNAFLIVCSPMYLLIGLVLFVPLIEAHCGSIPMS